MFDLPDWLIALAASIFSALVGGKLWGHKKYEDGKRDEREGLTDELRQKQVFTKNVIEEGERVIEESARREKEDAELYFQTHIGRKPTASELASLLEDSKWQG